ncbi:MAG TPA: hypothetical protein VFB41_08995 [Solirubrobacteraceae bacterium]|nr:hypothetical protein [Solirubrobacteraceae bacterium]
MARSSHALADDGRVWIVDPVDWAPALDRVAALGEPAAVIQLLDRHKRDSALIAARLGVPHLTVPEAITDSPFELVRLTHRRWWDEVALWWPARRTLVVPEAVGTVEAFTLGAEQAGVHAGLRLTPPRQLSDFSPEHLLVGHGPALHDDAAPALAAAVDRSRRDIPLLLRRLPGLIRGARG